MIRLNANSIEFFNKDNCYGELELMIVIHVPIYPHKKIILSKKELINNLKRFMALKVWLENTNIDNISKAHISLIFHKAEISWRGNTITGYRPGNMMRRKLDIWEKEYYKTHNKYPPLEWYYK